MLRRFPLRWPRFEEDLSSQAPGGGLSAMVLGKAMSKSLGTFCKFGSANDTRPVAVCVWLAEWMRGMLSLAFKHFSFCNGNTTLVNAELILRHSIISPGSGWSGFSFSRTSLLVLRCLVPRDAPRRDTPNVLRLIAWPSSSCGSLSSTKSTYRGGVGEFICDKSWWNEVMKMIFCNTISMLPIIKMELIRKFLATVLDSSKLGPVVQTLG